MNKLNKWFLLFLQDTFARLANLGNGNGKLAKRHRSSDLLVAHKISTHCEDNSSILDIGCGSGHWLSKLNFFKNFKGTGIDLHIKEYSIDDIHLKRFNGKEIPFQDKSFDYSTIMYVLHHLSQNECILLLKEAIRVSKRRIFILEDSTAKFNLPYKLRNKIHLIQTSIEYSQNSSNYNKPPKNVSMFLTHDEWLNLFTSISEIKRCQLIKLSEFHKYSHHTLFILELKHSHCSSDPIL